MPYNFSDEDKTVQEFKETLPFGVSVVKLVGVTADDTEAGKPFIAVGVVNEAGIEDEVRLWFVSPQNANISFNNLFQVAVHCTPEEHKDKMRDALDKITDTVALAQLMNDKCIGKELWYTKYYDPSRMYSGKDGQQRRSINKSIYGYEPKLKPELMPKRADENGDPLEGTPLAGGENITKEASGTIPKAW